MSVSHSIFLSVNKLMTVAKIVCDISLKNAATAKNLKK